MLSSWFLGKQYLLKIQWSVLSLYESCPGWKLTVVFCNNFSCQGCWVWNGSASARAERRFFFLPERFWTILKSFYSECVLFSVNTNFPLNGALKNSPQWILSYSFWQVGKFPREVANINNLCATLGASWCPTSLKQLTIVGTGFASCCCTGCWSWPVGAIVWELLPKTRVSLASRPPCGGEHYLHFCFPASVY